MERRDLVFFASFAVTLLFLLYLLGASITGNVIQTMYCEDGVCKDLCRFDADCRAKEVCCGTGFGYCETYSLCKKLFVFEPALEPVIGKNALVYQSPEGGSDALLYVLIILVLIILAVIYFLHRRKPRRGKKKRP